MAFVRGVKQGCQKRKKPELEELKSLRITPLTAAGAPFFSRIARRGSLPHIHV